MPDHSIIKNQRIESSATHLGAESNPVIFEAKSGEIAEESKFRSMEEAEMEVVMYLEYMGGKESINNVETNVLWKERFEPQCGTIRYFLDSRNIFAISGDNDCVTVLRNNIRKAAINKKTDIHQFNGSSVASVGITPNPTRKIGRTSSLREKNRHKVVPVETAGKIAISCFTQGFDLEILQRRFRQLDYTSILSNKVLHVTNKSSHFLDSSREIHGTYSSTSNNGIYAPGTRSKIEHDKSEQTTLEMEGDTNFAGTHEYCDNEQSSFHRFDLFVFSYGAIVWWGYDMQLYKNIEKEFNPGEHAQYFSNDSECGRPINDSYTPKQVKELFPVWCTFELIDRRGHLSEQDKYVESTDSFINNETLKLLYSPEFPFSLPFYSNTAFLEALQRDHVLLPVDIPSVKQAISHALAQSAKLDIIEPGVRDLLSICKPLPVQIKEKGYTNIKNRKVNQLKGQLFLLRMELKSDSELFDEPEFFWDFPWFKQFFLIVREDYCIESRISLLDEKLSAVQLTLDMIGNQFNEEHGRRLEWIIIVLILIEILIAIAELMLEMSYGVLR